MSMTGLKATIPSSLLHSFYFPAVSVVLISGIEGLVYNKGHTLPIFSKLFPQQVRY
jgi:hypothetical protein